MPELTYLAKFRPSTVSRAIQRSIGKGKTVKSQAPASESSIVDDNHEIRALRKVHGFFGSGTRFVAEIP